MLHSLESRPLLLQKLKQLPTLFHGSLLQASIKEPKPYSIYSCPYTYRPFRKHDAVREVSTFARSLALTSTGVPCSLLCDA